MWYQNFKYEGGYFTNVRNNNVFEVVGSNDVEGYNASLGTKKTGANQRWRIVYVDSISDQTKGLNKDFGFFVNRPFYIRSRLPMKRIAECVGANNVNLKRWRKNSLGQQWFFDPVTKTIRNQQWKSHSLDIQGNGASANVRCTTTNSRWW